jgi:hypothetical protein
MTKKMQTIATVTFLLRDMKCPKITVATIPKIARANAITRQMQTLQDPLVQAGPDGVDCAGDFAGVAFADGAEDIFKRTRNSFKTRVKTIKKQQQQ